MRTRPRRKKRQLLGIRAEQVLDLSTAYAIEMVGYGKLASHKANPSRLCRGRWIERHDFDQWFASPGDDEWLAFGGQVNET